MISHIFFDIDNTLYPKSSRLLKEVDTEISQFVASYLSVSVDEAKKMRQNRGSAYATTYAWLSGEHGFGDIDAYMEAVHPRNIEDFLLKNPDLPRTLKALGRRLFVLTNAPIEHALRVLEYLEIDGCFEHIFDLKQNRYIGKPDKDIMKKNVLEAGGTPETSLLVDDMPGHVLSFMEMGGYGLVVDEDGDYEGPLPRIGSVLELTRDGINSLEGSYLAHYGGGSR
ncbi:MAG: HAD family hydrolase [Spirochaetales bacterium]|nr:HAD family hydrolase [Spirochaetales bacterium]